MKYVIHTIIECFEISLVQLIPLALLVLVTTITINPVITVDIIMSKWVHLLTGLWFCLRNLYKLVFTTVNSKYIFSKCKQNDCFSWYWQTYEHFKSNGKKTKLKIEVNTMQAKIILKIKTNFTCIVCFYIQFYFYIVSIRKSITWL